MGPAQSKRKRKFDVPDDCDDESGAMTASRDATGKAEGMAAGNTEQQPPGPTPDAEQPALATNRPP